MEITLHPTIEIQIKLTSAEAEWLTALAARQGIAPADLIERAIEAFLETAAADERADASDWHTLGLSAFQAGWDNAEDAIYDNWRELYGVGAR